MPKIQSMNVLKFQTKILKQRCCVSIVKMYLNLQTSVLAAIGTKGNIFGAMNLCHPLVRNL